MTFLPRYIRRLLLTAGLLSVFTGCSGRNALDVGKLVTPERPAQPGPVSRIVPVWKPAQGRDMNGSPARGVAGQIFFFTPGNDSPIPVDGTVVIYVFDNQGTPEEQKKPIHRFRFEPDAWNMHRHKGRFGTTYHVFIPYTRKVVHQVEASFNVRFFPRKSSRRPVSSEMVAVTLPGPLRKEDREPEMQIVSRPNSKTTNVTTYNERFAAKNAFTPGKRNSRPKTEQTIERGSSRRFHNFDLSRPDREPRDLRRTSGLRRDFADDFDAAPRRRPPLRERLQSRRTEPVDHSPLDDAMRSDERRTGVSSGQSFRLSPAPGAVQNDLDDRRSLRRDPRDEEHPLDDGTSVFAGRSSWETADRDQQHPISRRHPLRTNSPFLNGSRESNRRRTAPADDFRENPQRNATDY